VENIESIWQLGLLALAAGALIGALGYRLFAPSLTRADKLRSELEAARQELIDYKASVNSHFDKTSELVNDLTQNYVKVYQHLAEGAQTLGGSRQLNNLLEQQQGKVLLTVDDELTVETAPAPAAARGTAARRPSHETAPAADSSLADDSAEPAAEVAAEVATEETSQTPKDRPAEAAAAMATEEVADSEQATQEVQQTAGTGSAADADQAKAAEPVIDVSKIGQGDAKSDKTETELGTLIPEPGNGEGIKPTHH
jgi:uncharacterized membrane-anchored protein YhcB (DUF1043 family)